MRIKIFVITVFWLLSCFVSAEAQSKPCGCEDKEEMLNFLNETQMAIQEYNFQLDLITAQEKAEGKTVMFSPDGSNKLLITVQNSMSAVYKKGMKSGYVEFNSDDCSIKDTGVGNFCIQQAKMIINRIYQKVCMETLSIRSPGTSYRTQMKMSQIIRESIAAYRLAQLFILQMLESLPKNCRPNNWFGYVVLQKIDTNVSNEINPANTKDERGSNGSNQTQNSKTIYIGTVLVEEGKPVNAKVYSAYSYDRNYNGSIRTVCSSKKPIQIQNEVNANGEAHFAEGESNGTADFALNVYPAKKTYSILVDFFSVNMTGQTKGWGSSIGGCREGKRNDTFPLNKGAGKSGHSVTNEKIDSPDFLQGSKVEKPPNLNVSMRDETDSPTGGKRTVSVTTTYEIQMRWMLRRLPAK